jgi:hypothetical protein
LCKPANLRRHSKERHASKQRKHAHLVCFLEYDEMLIGQKGFRLFPLQANRFQFFAHLRDGHFILLGSVPIVIHNARLLPAMKNCGLISAQSDLEGN